MKRHLAIVAFGLFSFASLSVSAAAAKAAAKPAAKAPAPDHRRFQQFCDDLSNASAPNGSLRDFNSRLKQLGNDGWELSGMTANVACYKRELAKGLPAEPMAWLPAQAPTRTALKLDDEAAPAVAAPAPLATTTPAAPAKPVVAKATAAVGVVATDAKPVAVAKPLGAKPADAKPAEAKAVVVAAPAADKQVALTAPTKPTVKINKAATASTTVPASAKAPAKAKTQTATASDDDSVPAPTPSVRRALVPKS